MPLSQTKTPARLTEPATRKLPRNILFWLMSAYILAGLFWRDPWKTDDITGLATMLSLLEQPSTWLTTHVGSMPLTQEGPLSTWIGALFIALFSPVFGLFIDPFEAKIAASRLPNLLYFFGLMWGIWYGTYLLARRPEAQPLPLPFGGEPNPRDYGRMMADVAFLFTIATAGIIVKIHETSPFPLILALHSLAFYGFVRMLDHPIQATAVLSVTISGAFFARGLLGAGPLILCTFTLLFTCFYSKRQKFYLLLALAIATLLAISWTTSSKQADLSWFREWWYWNTNSFALEQFSHIAKNMRDLVWFLWPSWPFAVFALWNWRHWYKSPHIFIPAALMISNFLIVFAISDSFEMEYAPLTIPMVVLAAMAIPTLRRSVINLLDWYSIMVISLFFITVWLGWIALYLGWPSKINHNIMRLIQGFDVSINYLAVIAGLLITLIWALLVRWRLSYNPSAMWRGIVLTAAGATCSWLIIVILWMPAVDYNRSYRLVGQNLAQVVQRDIPADACVRTQGMGLGQRSALYVFSGIHFSNSSSCQYVLIQTNSAQLDSESKIYADLGTIIWQGQRRSERHGETFLLLKRFN